MYRRLAISSLKGRTAIGGNRIALNSNLKITTFHVDNIRLISNDSFVGAFINSVRRQVKENKDFTENMKQLQDKSNQLGDSEALRKAKEIFAKAKSDVSDNAATKAVNDALIEVKKHADSVGKTVEEVLKEINENEFVKANREMMHKVGETIHKSTEPIRNSPVYKTVKSEVESLADDASRYGGYSDKERRMRNRQKLNERIEKQNLRAKLIKADPTAGENVVLHKDSAWKESWDKFKDNSSVVQGLFKIKRNYDESENSFITYTRDVTDSVSEKLTDLFSESEQAKAIKIIRSTVDPAFTTELFLKEAREYIVPEFLDSFAHADLVALKQWCSEASFNVLKATFEAQTSQGLVSDSKILDLRKVDVHSIKLLEDSDNTPVIITSFETQEVIIFRNKKSKEIVFGKEDHIERVQYVLVLTKLEAELDNPLTNGWKIMELARQQM